MYGRKVKLRFLFVIIILITLILTTFLILKSLEENVVYFQSPSEIKSLSEIKKYTKISMVEWFKKTKPILDSSLFIKFYIEYSREELLKNINIRVDQMFKQGVIKEVKKFNKLKVKKENSATKVIGIREINDMIEGKSNFNETKEKIAIKTRQYAKRQTTWARRYMKSWKSIRPDSINLVLKKFK